MRRPHRHPPNQQHLVPDDDTWLVDQAVNLMDGTDPTAVREALKRK
ncbi:hypothetical protein [Streptomyces sp. NPDC002526]